MVPKALGRLVQRDRIANACGYFIDQYCTCLKYPGGHFPDTSGFRFC